MRVKTRESQMREMYVQSYPSNAFKFPVVRLLERVALEKRVLQQLFARPALRGVLVQTFLRKKGNLFVRRTLRSSWRHFANLHEVDAFGPDEILWQLVVQRIYNSRVGNDEPSEELVRLEDGHVPRDQVADVLADQIELVDVRLARPQRLSLREKDEERSMIFII